MSSRPPRTRFRPPSERIGFLLYRAGLAVGREYERTISGLGFSPTEVGLMTHVAAHGPDHVRSIARVLGVSAQTVLNQARGLEQSGLLVRTEAPSDRRLVVLELTDEGRRALSNIDVAANTFDVAIAGLLGETDVSGMAAALRRLLASGIGEDGSD